MFPFEAFVSRNATVITKKYRGDFEHSIEICARGMIDELYIF